MLATFAIAAIVLAHAPTVEWHAPPECPDAAAFTRRVSALLPERDDLEATAFVTVAADPQGGFTAEVRCVLANTATVRQVHGAACESVADAAALMLAVQIDALAVGRTMQRHAAILDAPVPPVRSPATTRASSRVSRPPPATPNPRVRRVRGGVRLGGGASFRQLPGVAPTIELGAALLIERARVQLDATWVLDRTVRLGPPNASAGADVMLVSAALRGGFGPAVGTVEFPILGGIEVGDMTARGVGVDNSRLRHAPWVAALVGAGVAWVPVRAFALRLDPSLAIALARPRFGIEVAGAQRPLYQPPVLGIRLAIALEVRFG